MYYPLHVHTCVGSIGDSILKIMDYIKKAKDLGLDKLAITNHGSLSDMYDFYSKCKKEGIEPIIGCEVYLAENQEEKTKEYTHLVLIAKNNTGIKNLLQIVNDACLNGMYYKPRTSLQIIEKYSEGIICLSACIAGKIPNMILELEKSEDQEKQYELIKNEVKKMQSIFKKDFYLEIQPGNFKEQITVNRTICQLSKDCNCEIVVTNDIHYLDKEDAFIHNAHICIERKLNLKDNPKIYPDEVYYLMDEKELRNYLFYLPKDIIDKAIDNTKIIADQCHISLNIDHIDMPSVEIPEGYTEDTYLSKLCYDSFFKKINQFKDIIKYQDRLEEELYVLKELGFSGYFLTLLDKVKYAENNHIPIGPGRGSVVGSLVSYLVGITKIDPLKYNLLFERFLSIYRKNSIPDIDFDVSSNFREAMFKYTINKHGKEKCALVSTVAIRKAKSAIKDVARILGYEPELGDTIAKLIPVVYYPDDGDKITDLSITESLKFVPELQAYQKQYPKLFELAQKLEGLPRNSSIHAAGTLISSEDLSLVLPLRKKSDDSFINATALNLKDAETAGKIKFDYLALSTLDIIGKVEKESGFIFDYENEELFKDEKVWKLIGSKHTTTLFQIGSKTYKDRMKRLAPKTIEELAACLALVRGPCISDKLDEQYMQIVEKKIPIKKIHPIYDKVTEKTNGIIIYQEQIMILLNKIGFSLEDSFKIMKFLAKKNADKILESKEQYDRLTLNLMTKEIAEYIWSILLKQGQYCFNKSHAVAYAYLCYISAYYKIYYPNMWMAASLTNAYERNEEIKETVMECRHMGIKFKELNCNTSDWDFKVYDNNQNIISIGMSAIKGLGKKAYDTLISYRPYKSLEDLIERVPKKDFNKSRLNCAIFAGLFSNFNSDIFENYRNACIIKKEEPSGVLKIGKESIDLDSSVQDIEAFVLNDCLITSPINELPYFDFNNIKYNKLFKTKGVITKIKKLKDKNQNQMAFLTIAVGSGIIDGVIFSTEYNANKKLLKTNLSIDIEAIKKNNDSCVIKKIS